MDQAFINMPSTSGSSAVNPKLEGLENWTTWKFQIKVLLKALEIYNVVDGSEVIPTDQGNNRTAWLLKDAKAQSIIVTRVSNKVMLQVITCESAKEIWDKLHMIYEQTSETSLHIVQQKFFTMQYNSGEEIASFIARVEETVCQIKQANGDVPEKMVLTKILTSLPESYKHFISAWESVSENNQTLSALTSRLLIEEQRSNNKQEVTALVAKSNSENRKCFKCGKTGHYKKDCYKVTKYCENCKKTGHIKKNCWFLNKKRENRNEHLSNAFSASNSTCFGQKQIDDWIVDSGASDHMCHDEKHFFKYEKLNPVKNIMIGDGTMMEAVGSGLVKLEAFNGQEWIKTTINNVLHVPKMAANLFSVGAATSKGYKVMINNDQCDFVKENKVGAIGRKENKIFKMCFRYDISYANMGYFNESLNDWHCKLAHQNNDQVKMILKRSGIKYEENNNSMCLPCIKGKQHKIINRSAGTRANKPGQLIHMDLCGPMETTSLGGARYFLLIKDDYSCYKTVYFLKNKSETANKINEFIKMTKNTPGHVIQNIRSDNGTEFVNSTVKQLLIENGIQHQTSVAYTPEQNGCAEREMRTVVEAARTMLLENNLNKCLWAEAVNTAIFTTNRTGSSRIKNKTPYELWFNRNLYDINKFKKFGLNVAVHIPDQLRLKWDAKSEIGIFVGYGENTKGYRIYFPNKNIVSLKKDVIFIAGNTDQEVKEPEDENPIQDIFKETAIFQEEGNVNIEAEKQKIEENTEVEVSETERNQRKRKPPKWFEDYETSFLSIYNEPSSYKEAMETADKENWIRAIQKEMDTLKENNTWIEVEDFPENAQIVSSKWVFRIKSNFNGQKEYKARLVARGFEQKDCDSEIYAPVARMTTFRIFMAIANNMNLPVYQLDVTGAFLYGDIKETVFMKLPEGTKCKLNRSIYGLKKSPKYWNEKFDCFMLNQGFLRSQNDLCLYIKFQANNSLFLLIYVDDILIFGSDNTDIEKFKILLNESFKTKYLGLASNYLGISITQDLDKGITVINQKTYLESILEKFGMSNCKPIETPIDQNYNFEILKKEKSESETIERKCRQLIGSLLYAVSGTRPDLCVSVIFLSRYQHCASTALYKAIQRILRYIKHTLDLSLHYKRNSSDSKVKCFVDADWAGDVGDRKSTSGYILTIFGCTISWQSKKQPTVSLSSTEAEYIALSFAITEACWIKKLLLDFKLDFEKQIEIFEDNQSVIKLTKSNENNKRLKHVDIKYHYIIDNIRNGFIKLEYIKSADNVADMFTKPLGKILYHKFRNCILK